MFIQFNRMCSGLCCFACSATNYKPLRGVCEAYSWRAVSGANSRESLCAKLCVGDGVAYSSAGFASQTAPIPAAFLL